jgi:hypothetical protein
MMSTTTRSPEAENNSTDTAGNRRTYRRFKTLLRLREGGEKDEMQAKGPFSSGSEAC